MRITTLGAVISSVLLGSAVTAYAGPETDAAPAPSDTAQSAPANGTNANESVGAGQSNVDEHSTSGDYYPYAAGTVGDDPAKPTSTKLPADAGNKADDPSIGPTERWMQADGDGDGYLSQAELGKAAPNLTASFDAIDVNHDDKLTRDELRTWHESHKASMEADQGDPGPSTDATSPQSKTPNSTTGDSSTASGEQPASQGSGQ